jgi:Tol biopolymer transport system component
MPVMRHATMAVFALCSLLWCCTVPVTNVDSTPAEPAFQYRFITHAPGAIDLWPCFAPDGRTILFSRTMDKGRTWDLFVVPVSGGEPRRFSAAPLPVSATRANWSQDNGLIAFTGETPGGGTSLWLINSDGTEPRRMQASGLSDGVYYPSWYPAGKRLALVDFSGGEGGVLRQVGLAGDAATPLTNRQQVLAGMPRVSPDGRWIAFAGQENRGQTYDQEKNSIWLRDDAGKLHVLDAKQGRAPAWSPDGQWLAFESERGSLEHLYAIFIARRTGGATTQITPHAIHANHPAWSPDGKLVVLSGLLPDNQDSACGRECPRGLVIAEIPKL